jgi:hypothetical protein
MPQSDDHGMFGREAVDDARWFGDDGGRAVNQFDEARQLAAGAARG